MSRESSSCWVSSRARFGGEFRPGALPDEISLLLDVDCRWHRGMSISNRSGPFYQFRRVGPDPAMQANWPMSVSTAEAWTRTVRHSCAMGGERRSPGVIGHTVSKPPQQPPFATGTTADVWMDNGRWSVFDIRLNILSRYC